MSINTPYNFLGAAEVLQANKANLDFGGMQPTYKQLENYDHLFDKSDKYAAPGTTVSYSDGGLDKTLDLIQQYVSRYSYQVAKLAQHLQHSNARQFAFNIWHFCKLNMAYRLDDFGKEQLRTPARAWADRFSGVDCDCFTIFVACILREAKQPCTAHIVAFNHKQNFQHIYPVCKGIVIDPVMNEFGKHPDYITKTKKMEIEGLHGTYNEVPYMMGLGSFEPIDSTTALMMQEREKKLSPDEQRKLDLMILNNGNEEREFMLRLMPFIQDISPSGNYIFKHKFIADFIQASMKGKDVEPILTRLNDDEYEVLEEVVDILNDADIFLNDDGEDITQEDVMEGLGAKKFAAKRAAKIKKKAEKASAKNPNSNKAKRLTTKAKIKDAKATGNKPALEAAKKERKERIKDNAKKVGQAVLKVFPLTVAARNAFLGMMRLNVGNIAGRIRLGYITQDQAVKDGYSVADWQEAKKRVANAEKKWKNLGGNVSKFKEAALKGGVKKPLFTKDKGLNGFGEIEGLGTVIQLPVGTNAYDSLYGLGSLGIEPVTTALIAAAGTALAAILPVLAGFKPKKKGAEGEAEETENSDKNFLQKALDFGKKVVGKAKGVVDKVRGKSNATADNAADGDTSDDEDEEESGSGMGFIGWALGLTAAAGIGYVAFKR